MTKNQLNINEVILSLLTEFCNSKFQTVNIFLSQCEYNCFMMMFNLPSRAELISWLNEVTKVKVEKLEQLADGIHFCQIFDTIYPKIINLSKLKKDPKTILENEKNFRLLLNAVDQLQLSVKVNIMDLAAGKITAILELLQWMWKESQKVSRANKNPDQREKNYSAPKIIKSYVGKLFLRPPQGLNTNNETTETAKSVASERRSLSLDARLKSLPKTQNSGKRSVKTGTFLIEQKSAQMERKDPEKKNGHIISSVIKGQSQKAVLIENKDLNGLDASQNQDLTVIIDQNETFEKKSQQQMRSSTKKSQFKKIGPEKFLKLCSEKKAQLQRRKEEKKNPEIRRQRQLDDGSWINEILDSTMSLEREKLCQKLIKVTAAAYKDNPELEEKLKRILLQDESSNSEKGASGQRPLTIYQSSGSQKQEASLRVENDTFEEIDIDGPFIENIEPNQRTEFVEPPQNSRQFLFNQEGNSFGKKDTIKKTSVKQNSESSENPLILSSQAIKKISAQKQHAHGSYREDRNQNMPQNCLNRPYVKQSPSIFSRNQLVQGENIFTQQKREFNGPVFNQVGYKSENPSLFRHNEMSWSKNRNEGTENPQREVNPVPEKKSVESKEKKENEVKYPELEPYPSVTAPKLFPPQNMRLF